MTHCQCEIDRSLLLVSHEYMHQSQASTLICLVALHPTCS